MPITCGSPQPLKQHNQDGIHPFVSDPPPLPFFLSVWPELILLFIISFSKGISFFLSLIARFSQLFSDHPVPVGQLFPGAFLTPFKAECVCLSLSLTLSSIPLLAKGFPCFKIYNGPCDFQSNAHRLHVGTQVNDVSLSYCPPLCLFVF